MLQCGTVVRGRVWFTDLDEMVPSDSVWIFNSFIHLYSNGVSKIASRRFTESQSLTPERATAARNRSV